MFGELKSDGEGSEQREDMFDPKTVNETDESDDEFDRHSITAISKRNPTVVRHKTAAITTMSEADVVAVQLPPVMVSIF